MLFGALGLCWLSHFGALGRKPSRFGTLDRMLSRFGALGRRLSRLDTLGHRPSRFGAGPRVIRRNALMPI